MNDFDKFETLLFASTGPTWYDRFSANTNVYPLVAQGLMEPTLHVLPDFRHEFVITDQGREELERMESQPRKKHTTHQRSR